jgi:hypothetical protein
VDTNDIFKLAQALSSGRHGSFMACLGEALFAADSRNQQRLLEAFQGEFERVLVFEKSQEKHI